MAWAYERLVRGRKAIQKLIRRRRSQIKREVVFATLSSLLFAILAAGTYVLYCEGFTRIYTSWKEYPFWYFLISIPIVLFAYETYYYWLHRWMHRRSIFKLVHRVHHQSIHPTVFTSFAFHPTEALLQFIFFPVLVVIMPIHYLALGIVLMLFTLSAVINHAGVEVFPEKFHDHPLHKWLIGSTHHNIHHEAFGSNFGLCFTFWDRWMKTEHSDFRKRFAENRTKLIQSQSLRHRSADGPHT